MPLYMDVHTMGGVVAAPTWPPRTWQICRPRTSTTCAICATGSTSKGKGVLSGRGTLRGSSGNRSSAGARTGRR